ncbi:biotin--[acetyl-CoA-carboxylase] ligase [Clostridium cellulovorans]|uniref:biotin--[biotin carboxyl-carrier protein] ligase n=1 Tax=Clostridium cellulovorans (strain ATCC 35296 / DSM 3052 / OCM 3 / 743B) TaxID=573061 RepID=D9SMF1_CLOC7|nr:biotin--[acetyl-CoA-carboxylase] ligase [Clostridium cellulovorans]ADL53807.1 biotin/acetyl-CoA-carboxylase ligase [Clostridium cellulovorans 743B]
MERKLSYVSTLENLNTCCFGKTFLYLPTIDSTNIKAKELANQDQSKYPNGFLIISEEQTNGKGRLGRTWHSPSGCGLWFSLILRPNINLVDIPKITLISAVALCDSLKNSGVDSQIKWPNDILINNKKIAGILTEMSSLNSIVNFVILGIGLNVNTKASQFPLELKETASSLFIEYGNNFDKSKILADFLYIFEDLWFKFLTNGSFDHILAKYKETSTVLHKKVKIINAGKESLVFVKDITEDGSLLVVTADGDEKLIISGEVSLRL